MLVKSTLDQGAEPPTSSQELAIATEKPGNRIERYTGRSRKGLGVLQFYPDPPPKCMIFCQRCLL